VRFLRKEKKKGKEKKKKRKKKEQNIYSDRPFFLIIARHP
jgi:hypothetical protein